MEEFDPDKMRSIAALMGIHNKNEIAHRVGIHHHTMYNLIDRKSKPCMGTLEKICKALNCSVSDLMNEGENKNEKNNKEKA